MKLSKEMLAFSIGAVCIGGFLAGCAATKSAGKDVAEAAETYIETKA